jgi:hypothetical protein
MANGRRIEIRGDYKGTSFIYLFVFCCVGWGYIVAFTKLLTIYHI